MQAMALAHPLFITEKTQKYNNFAHLQKGEVKARSC